MKTAPVADLKAHLSAYLEECEADGPIVITRDGKAIAVLLAPHDEDDLERILLGRSAPFQAMLNRSRQSIKDGKGLSESEFWKAVRLRRNAGKPANTPRRRSKPAT